MSQAEFDKLLDHEYDGIREYDNPLPFWWVGIFILTIVFSVAYWLYYHGGGPGVSEIQAYEQEMAAWKEQEAKRAAKAATVDEATLAAMSKDPKVLQAAASVYKVRCLPCHGDKGQGVIGPNLTDVYQIHGKTRMDIYRVIRDGVPQKGMVAWKNILKPKELAEMAAYVASLHGKNVPGKKPEGAKVPAFE